jgi:superfamily II DNA or RNA helicase
MIATLRAYQIAALEAIRAQLLADVWSQVLVCGTGGGKTFIFAHLPLVLRDWLAPFPRARMLILAHREELLDQAARHLVAINPSLSVGVEQGSFRAGPLDDVVIASVQTLTAAGGRRLKALHPEEFRIIVTDECFPAGTLVDGRPIETIRPGDIVSSCDTATGKIQQKRVVRCFKRPVGERLITVRSSGYSVTCTPNHKFWTDQAWRQADQLQIGDRVYLYEDEIWPVRSLRRGVASHDAISTTQALPEDRMPKSQIRSSQGAADPNHVRGVRMCDDNQRSQAVVSQEYEIRDVLLSRTPVGVALSPKQHDDGRDQSALCESPNDREEPDEASCQCRKNAPSDDWPDVSISRRKRANNYSTTGDGVGIAEFDLRASDSDGRRQRAIPITADELQGGSGGSFGQAGHRGGRQESSIEKVEISGCSENSRLICARVDSITRHQSTSDGEFGGLCPTGHVYNLEVEDFHTYFANGILVSNCHHASAESYQTVLRHFNALPPEDLRPGKKATPDEIASARLACQHWWATQAGQRLLLGCTATPARADGVGLEWSFQQIVYEKSLRSLIEDGYLVPPRGFLVDTTTDLDGVHLAAGDFRTDELAAAVNTPLRNALAVAAWKRRARNKYGIVRPTLAFTVDIQHAQDVARMFQESGVRADWASGDKREPVQAFREGKIDVLCSCSLISEGFDHPPAGIALMLRPTKSQTLYVQQVGRVLRLADQKYDALIIDVVDVARKHALVSASDLFGLPAKFNAEGASLLSVAQRIEAIQQRLPDAPISDAHTIAESERRLQAIDLWHVRTSATVHAHARLSWTEDSATLYHLGIPRVAESGAMVSRSDRLELRQDLLGTWAAVFVDGESQVGVTIGTAPSIDAIFVTAERWLGEIRPDVVRMKDRDATWRKRKPSPNQIELLKKLGAQLDFQKLTRGEASALLDQHFAAKDLSGARR